MKKFVIASILALTAGIASAQSFGGIEYNYRDGVGIDKGTDQQGATLTLGTTVAKDTTVDLKSIFRRTDGTGATGNRLEAGLTHTMNVSNNLAGYTRVAIGEKFNSGVTSDFSYYSIEPGIKYQVAPSLGVKVGYRYRNGFSSSDNYQTNTLRLGSEYSLNKTSSLTVGYDRSYKDQEFNGVNVGYNFKF